MNGTNEQKFDNLLSAIGSLGDSLVLEAAEGSREVREQNLTKLAAAAAVLVFAALAAVLIAFRSASAPVGPEGAPGSISVRDLAEKGSVFLCPAGFSSDYKPRLSTGGELGLYLPAFAVGSPEELAQIRESLFLPGADDVFTEKTKICDGAFFSEYVLYVVPATVFECKNSEPTLTFKRSGSSLDVVFTYSQEFPGGEYLNYCVLVAVPRADAPESVSAEFVGSGIFDAVVTEVLPKSLLVEVTGDTVNSGLTDGDLVYVSRSDSRTGFTAPDTFAVGDTVRVVHAGGVMETFPAQLPCVLAIEPVEATAPKVTLCMIAWANTFLHPEMLGEFRRGALNDDGEDAPVFRITSKDDLDSIRERAVRAGLAVDRGDVGNISFDDMAEFFGSEETLGSRSVFVIYVDEPRSSEIEYSLGSVDIDGGVLKVTLDCTVPAAYTEDCAGYWIFFAVEGDAARSVVGAEVTVNETVYTESVSSPEPEVFYLGTMPGPSASVSAPLVSTGSIPNGAPEAKYAPVFHVSSVAELFTLGNAVRGGEEVKSDTEFDARTARFGTDFFSGYDLCVAFFTVRRMSGAELRLTLTETEGALVADVRPHGGFSEREGTDTVCALIPVPKSHADYYSSIECTYTEAYYIDCRVVVDETADTYTVSVTDSHDAPMNVSAMIELPKAEVQSLADGEITVGTSLRIVCTCVGATNAPAEIWEIFSVSVIGNAGSD